MFKVPLLQRKKIISDDGFSLTFLSRYLIRYDEGNLSILVSIDGGNVQMDVFHSSMKVREGSNPSVIDSATDMRIIDNITRALEWKGRSVQVVS